MLPGHNGGSDNSLRGSTATRCSRLSVATFSGWSSLRSNQTFDEAERLEVAAISLSDLIRQEKLATVRLLKLDVEGGEMDALRGASEALRAGIVDYVLTEIEPARMKAFGWCGSDMARFMSLHGFRAVAIKRGSRLYPVDDCQEVPGKYFCDFLYSRIDLVNRTIHELFKRP